MANKTWVGGDTGQTGDYSVAANWSASGVPTATDDVRITALGTQYAIDAGLNQSAVAIGDFIVQNGYSKAIGTESGATYTYLQIDPNRFEFAGTGKSFIDLGSANIDCAITDTAGAASGKRGLYLKGSNLSDLSVSKGKVGVAFHHGETSTVSNAEVLGAGASLVCGEGTTLTSASVNQGELVLRCGATTVDCFAGLLVTEEEGAITTLNAFGGQLTLNSTGTITTLNIRGGATVDLTQSAIPRTITTVNLHSGVLVYDDSVVTITNKFDHDGPVSVSVSRA